MSIGNQPFPINYLCIKRQTATKLDQKLQRVTTCHLHIKLNFKIIFVAIRAGIKLFMLDEYNQRRLIKGQIETFNIIKLFKIT